MNFTMLCNCSQMLPCCAILYEFHYAVQFSINFTLFFNSLWILPCCAIVFEFHHIVQLFLNFTILLIGLCWCFKISPCCATIFEFQHIVQLFVISPFCVKLKDNVEVGVPFDIVVQLFMNFTMLCNYLWMSPY